MGLLALALAVFAGTPALAQSVAVNKSIPYASGPRTTLDVYSPRNARGAPVIVFMYGGSWQGGEKKTYNFVGEALAQQGYLTVVPDYRVYPQVRFPAFLQDSAKAVRWARDNAARFGGDPNNIYLMGHSAGAYNAAMLAYDGRWLGGAGMSPRQITGFIGLAGPYDFLPIKDDKLIDIFGGPNRPETQPISYASRRVPPSFVATGTFDLIVDPDNTTRLAARLRAAGNDVTVRRYFGAGHVTLVGAVGTPLGVTIPVLPDINAFIRRTSRAPLPR